MSTRNDVEKLRTEGKSYNEISKTLKISKASVSFHARNLNLNEPIKSKKLSDDKIREIIKLSENHQKKEVAKMIGVSYATVKRHTENYPKKTKEEIKINQYNAHKDWRQRIKKQCIEYLGGKCENCGYDKCTAALDFHHKDMNEKEFNISGGSLKSFEKLKPELDKCILLCANCHREIHNKHLMED